MTERKNQTIMSMVRNMLKNKNISLKFWVVNTYVYTLNWSWCNTSGWIHPTVKRGMCQCGGKVLYVISETNSTKCKQVLMSSNTSETLIGVLPRVLVQSDLPHPHRGGGGPVPSMRFCHLCLMTNRSILRCMHQDLHHSETQQVISS